MLDISFFGQIICFCTNLKNKTSFYDCLLASQYFTLYHCREQNIRKIEHFKYYTQKKIYIHLHNFLWPYIHILEIIFF